MLSNLGFIWKASNVKGLDLTGLTALRCSPAQGISEAPRRLCCRPGEPRVCVGGEVDLWGPPSALSSAVTRNCTTGWKAHVGHSAGSVQALWPRRSTFLAPFLLPSLPPPYTFLPTLLSLLFSSFLPFSSSLLLYCFPFPSLPLPLSLVPSLSLSSSLPCNYSQHC